MCEETPYLQPQPGTGESHPAWPTTPEERTHAPKRGKAVGYDRCVRENCDVSEGMSYLW